jgi:hypothetical protein
VLVALANVYQKKGFGKGACYDTESFLHRKKELALANLHYVRYPINSHC